jgi:hypothetical protein
MKELRVSITRFVDEAQPGWVECTFTDVHGKTWTVKEKVPIVTKASLTAQSHYPQPGVITCQIVVTWLDVTGREVVTIETQTTATTGETSFDVLAAQLI